MPGYEVIGDEELAEIQDVFRNGGVLFRHGFEGIRNESYKVKEFETAFAKSMGVSKTLAVSSGTAALRVALAAIGVGPGDEVITQSFTFVATVESIIEARAVPICADIDSSLNIDPQDLERKISPKTKAVIVVHMLGTPARLEEISLICRRFNIYLIEDVAWGCGGSLQRRPLGTWGDIGTFSFDFAKTITTGEGGMLTFKEEHIYRKAAAWHDHGHENNPTVPRWEDTRTSSGFNFRMMELQGAVGLAQLKKLRTIVSAQRHNKALLWNAISDLKDIKLRDAPEGSYETADALIIMLKESCTALRCREELLKVGLSTKILPEAYTWHFAGEWNHMQELVASQGPDLKAKFKKSHDILSRAVALPVGVYLKPETPQRLRDALIKALTK